MRKASKRVDLSYQLGIYNTLNTIIFETEQISLSPDKSRNYITSNYVSVLKSRRSKALEKCKELENEINVKSSPSGQDE